MSEAREDLPSDPQLSRLYRQFANVEPSLALDRKVLHAARAAIDERRELTHGNVGWRRWRGPLVLATTVVLSVMLALMHEKAPAPLPPGDRDDRQQVVTQSEDRPAPSVQAAPTATTTPTSELPSRKLNSARAKVDDSAQPRGYKAPVAEAEQQGRLAAEERATDPRASSTEAKRERSPAAPGVVAGSGAAVRDAQSSTPLEAAKSATPAVAKVRTEPSRLPAAWLDEIRVLRRDGRVDEATRQLRDFQRTYPDYPLPDDLRSRE